MSDSAVPAPYQRIFLVVVDDSEELNIALTYACLRARNTGGRVALLYVMEPSDFQHWIAVEDIMREERRTEAEQVLQRHAKQVNEITGTLPILYVREGERRDELLALINEEPSISILVLAAGTGPEGPGPLVSHLAGKGVAKLRIPLTLVPGSLRREQLDLIT
ncbi:universal stress protein [Skermanella stibiiresistens SB22]|uniref:Universal stress protein n=1 Tax=Skermanella stibiiresistens SB22 TaxID=1385369 RepID=W9H6U8_9PROT|nr:universal stress protein [Skermanella stibiiresistens]EWY40422.1 universal stress protein [Skermanella stibiiresistens SB22]